MSLRPVTCIYCASVDPGLQFSHSPAFVFTGTLVTLTPLPGLRESLLVLTVVLFLWETWMWTRASPCSYLSQSYTPTFPPLCFSLSVGWRISLGCWDCSWTQVVAQASLELVIFLSQAPKQMGLHPCPPWLTIDHLMTNVKCRTCFWSIHLNEGLEAGTHWL